MLKTIDEWNDRFGDSIGYGYLKFEFNKKAEKLKFYVFCKCIDEGKETNWAGPYIEWMEENYPNVEHGTEYTGFCASRESIVFMFNNKEVAAAFKLRWM